MMHRNLTTSEWTLMALESLMERGRLADWREFAQALKGNEQLARNALRVSEYVEDRASASLMRVLVEQQFPGLAAGGGGLPTVADFEQIISSPTAAYDEGLAFFRGQGVLNRTLLRIVADLERNGIDYAVIGAVALNGHGYKRFTEDIDILLTEEGLRKFQEHLVGLGYRPAFPGATRQFKTTGENVRVEVKTPGEYPGDGLPKRVVFPDPSANVEEIDGVRTITMEKLIELKLASGMTAADRLRDLADVQEIIKIKGLGAEFAEKLDESVREKFRELQQAIVQARAGERCRG